MIQARGLWADRRSDLALTFLLLVSILCMITGEFASGTADLAGREGFFAMPWQETEWRILSGKQEAIEEEMCIRDRGMMTGNISIRPTAGTSGPAASQG